MEKFKKMKRKYVLALLVFVLLLGPGIASFEREENIAQEVRAQSSDEYDFLIYRPRTGTDLPLIVYLHGSGETGRNFTVLKKRNPHYWAKGKIEKFILVAPLATWEGWNSEKLVRLVERLCRDEQVDPDRVYLTGFSMGGGATFRIAADRPDLFAAIVPVAGGGHPDHAASLQNMPVWAFHGETDEIIPLFHSSDMIDAIRETGNANAHLTVLPGAGHGIAANIYSRREIYTWMLQYRRKK